MSASIASAGYSSPSPALTTGTGPSKRFDKQAVEDAFLKEAHKTPAQRMRDAVLKKMGLTEEALAAMDPKTRSEVEKTIAEEIKRQIEANGNKDPGQITDKQV